MKKLTANHSITSGIAIIGTIIVGVICHFTHKSSATVQNTPSSNSDSTVCFKGVPLSELSELANEIYHGISCSIDKYGFLVYKYKTNSGKTCDYVQITLDETGALKNLGRRYPGQIWSSADAFIKRANEKFKFTK